MRTEYHMASSAVISTALYVFFRSWELSVANFLTGVFIDIDHIVDYVAERGRDFNIIDFFKVFYEDLTQKVYVLLHSWELMVTLFMVAWLTGWNVWAVGFLIGYGVHMIMDQFSAETIRAYSLIWRVRHGFERVNAFSVNPLYKKGTKDP